MTREPKIENVEAELHSVVASREDLLELLNAPPDGKLTLVGDKLIVEWLRRTSEETLPLFGRTPVRPAALSADGVPHHKKKYACDVCGRQVVGTGPFHSHLKFHRQNHHVRPAAVGRRSRKR